MIMHRRVIEKAATHHRIIGSASKLVRRKGLGAASVVRVMRGAGLTAGGFYAHFRSKRAMDAEILRATMADMRGRWFAGLEDSTSVEWITRVAKRYLSKSHRDNPDEGCPLPAVLSELTRADKSTRRSLAEAFEIAAAEFTAHVPDTPGTTPRERALATLALCIGGLTLSRALRDHPASDEILRACVKWAVPETRMGGSDE